MSAVDTALIEINTALVKLAPFREGLKDFMRLDLGSNAHANVQLNLERYERRIKLLEIARDKLQDLVTDGHPAMTPREISEEEMTELVENAGTINGALTLFNTPSNVAVDMGLVAGPTELK